MGRRESAVIFLLLAGIIFAVYSNSLDNSFHYDDSHTIVSNEYITDIKNIPQFFVTRHMFSGTESNARHYRPLLLTTYAVNYYLGGYDSKGYHLFNILFHILVSFAVYLLVFEITGDKPASIFSAVIFGLNPFQTEAVNYISARSTVLATLFSVLSLYFHILLRKSGRIIFYFLSLLTLFLGLASKEIAIMTFFFFICYDICFYYPASERKKFYNSLWTYLPFVAGGLFYLVKYDIFKFLIAIVENKGNRSFYINLLTQSVVTLKYIKLFWFPFGLSIDHKVDIVNTVFSVKAFSAILAHLLIIGGAVYWYIKGKRALTFFVAFFYLASLPTIVIPLNILLFENRGYYPAVALVALSGIFLAKILKSGEYKKAFAAVLCCYFLVSVLLTVERNRAWATEETLWNDVLKSNPVSFKAYASLGAYYQDTGYNEQAEEFFKKSIDIEPTYFIPYIRLGNIYHADNRLEDAEKLYEKALEIRADYPAANYNLAVIYHMTNRIDLALEQYKKTIQLDPNHAMAHYNLGNLYLDSKDMLKAMFEYNETIRLKPAFIDVYYNVALVYDTIGKTREALESYKKFVKDAPPDYISHVTLAEEHIKRLEGRLNNTEEARK